MNRILCFILGLALTAAGARADTYWIAYEGNDFPEHEGWQRVSSDLQADRSLNDGFFVLDSLSSISIFDFYQRQLGGALDPDPGELFVLQWAVRIDQVLGVYDLSVGIFSDESWAVGFQLNAHMIQSAFEDDVSASFEPGALHEFEFRSPDMRSYELLIDGQPRIAGGFWQSLDSSRVGWGDGVVGAASLSHWDYVRFGVVPEPQGIWGLLTGPVWLVVRRARRASRRPAPKTWRHCDEIPSRINRVGEFSGIRAGRQ